MDNFQDFVVGYSGSSIIVPPSRADSNLEAWKRNMKRQQVVLDEKNDTPCTWDDFHKSSKDGKKFPKTEVVWNRLGRGMIRLYRRSSL